MTAPLAVVLKVLPHGEGLGLPTYATAGSAGADLAAALAEPVVLPPGGRALVPTGISLALPEGYEAQVRPRSGLAWRYGVTVLNSPGTIDSDYRGEISVILANLGSDAVTIARGDRIAQLVIAPVQQAAWQAVSELPPSARGAEGFGSSG